MLNYPPKIYILYFFFKSGVVVKDVQTKGQLPLYQAQLYNVRRAIGLSWGEQANT